MRTFAKLIVGFAVILFALLILVLLPSAAVNAATTPPPTVKLVAPSVLTEHLKVKKGVGFTAAFNLSVENDGPLIPAGDKSGQTGYQFSVVSDRNYAKSPDGPSIKANQQIPLAATTVTTVPVTLTVRDADTTSVTVVLTIASSSGILPSTETLTLTRSPLSANFVGILVGSIVVGILVVVVGLVPFKKPNSPDNSGIGTIYTEATFSFSQSWATSIAAVLTVVATVFSTAGVLTSLVPGIDTGFFLSVTIVYGVVLSLAPLVYSTLQRSQEGHVYGSHLGFVLAAAITGVAVGGQLSTVGAVIWLSDLSIDVRKGLLTLLGVVAFLVLAYTEATRRQLWQLPEPPPADPAHPAKPVTPMAALP